MEKLKKSFKKYGDNFLQIKQKGDWYIYSRTPYKWDRLSGEKVDKTPFTYGNTHYEIVKPIWINTNQSGERGWLYPSASFWGKFGYTISTLERAEEKLNKLAG